MATIAGTSAGVLMLVLSVLKPGIELRKDLEPPEITVVAKDYAFMPLPPIRSGPTVFSFMNQGKVDHEVAILRLKTNSNVETYVVLCNFRDKPDAPQHSTMGMYTTFTPK